MTHPDALSTWILTDGRLGMINQCRGLASALGVVADEKVVALAPPWSWLPPVLTPARLSVIAGDSDRLSPPWPDLVVATGRKSVAPALAVKRASGGTTFCVQIQNPDVRLDRFDLVITPAHDRLAGDNVISTLGSLHGINADTLEQARHRFAPALAGLPRPLVAVLLGGHNAVYQMDHAVAERLADNLADLSAHYGLAITASPRTPDAAVSAIKHRLDDALRSDRAVFWDGSGENPYSGYLAHADAIVVTADSVNMVSEAAATGKPVHIVELSGGSEKFSRFHHAMAEAEITRPFEGRIEQWSYPIPDDTVQAAQEIMRRMNVSEV